MRTNESAKSAANTPSKAPSGAASAQSKQTAITMLKQQHREAEALFTKIEETGDKAHKVREKLFETLAQKLELHMELEEAIFYPAAKEIATDLTLEAVEEHAVVKSLLAKIAGIDVADETFAPKIQVLKELVEHHVKEEEKELFPKCEKSLSPTQLQTIASQMQDKISKLETPEAKRESAAARVH